VDPEILKLDVLIGMINEFKYPANLPLTSMNVLQRVQRKGETANWDVKKAVRDIGTFEGLRSPAGKRKMQTIRQMSAVLARTFKFNDLDGMVLQDLRKPGTMQEADAANEQVRDETQANRRHLDRQDEYMIASALQGTLNMTIDGISHSVDYGLDASHNVTKTTKWDNPAADIIGDVRLARTKIAEDSGYEAAIALCSSEVTEQMLKNDAIQAYMSSTPAGQKLMEEGVIDRFQKLKWVEINATYKPEGGSITRFLDKTKVVIIPLPDKEWGEFRVGSDNVPSDDRRNIRTVIGRYQYSHVTHNPAGIRLYYGEKRLPLIKIPDAIYVMKVLA